MAQPQVADLLAPTSERRHHQFDCGPLVVAGRKIEPQWPPAARAIVAIAAAQCAHPLGLLVAAEFPRVEIFRDRTAAHAPSIMPRFLQRG
jgi:hypothetical protein